MNKNDNSTILYIVAFAIIGFLLYSNSKKNEKIKELEDALNSSNLITENVKKQLLQLIDGHPNIDEDVKNELEQIAILIGVQQESKAILGLAKIVENLLKRLYKNDSEFKDYIKSKNKRYWQRIFIDVD